MVTVLLGIQWLLDEHNLDSPAQEGAYNMCKKDVKLYQETVKKLVKKNIQDRGG